MNFFIEGSFSSLHTQGDLLLQLFDLVRVPNSLFQAHHHHKQYRIALWCYLYEFRVIGRPSDVHLKFQSYFVKPGCRSGTKSSHNSPQEPFELLCKLDILLIVCLRGMRPRIWPHPSPSLFQGCNKYPSSSSVSVCRSATAAHALPFDSPTKQSTCSYCCLQSPVWLYFIVFDHGCGFQ